MGALAMVDSAFGVFPSKAGGQNFLKGVHVTAQLPVHKSYYLQKTVISYQRSV